MDFNIHDLHLSRDWQLIKCKTITRKYFVEVFKVLCSIRQFLYYLERKKGGRTYSPNLQTGLKGALRRSCGPVFL